MLMATHLAYVHLYGHAAQHPPGYLAHGGRMQIGLVAPLIRPQHFDGTGVSGNLLERVRIPLDDHWQRSHHIWDEGGLWSVLEENSEHPELVARTITRRALLDDPIGLLRINLQTLGDYFDETRSRWKMLDDKGARIPDEDDLRLVRTWMGWDARGIESMESPARRSRLLAALRSQFGGHAPRPPGARRTQRCSKRQRKRPESPSSPSRRRQTSRPRSSMATALGKFP
jgi:hypothetical protein